MKNWFSKTLIVVLFVLNHTYGQQSTVIPQELQITEKDSLVVSSWIFGLGWNAVDDAGDEFSAPFNFSDNWNAVPFPSRLSMGKYFKSGLGLELIGAYNRYKEGKTIDGTVITEDIDYLSADLRVSYDLNNILGETGFFDPYIGIGAGYTDANNQGRGTYNAIVGFRTWFSDHWGLDFNSTGKWTMNTENSSNHIQHAVGVAYRFEVEKGLSRKGEEKLALLQEMEKEQQRVQDSIAAKQKADEEARLLAEQLQREREAAELAAAEKAKKETEDARRASLRNQLNDLGNVYFKLNSSYLTSRDKELLDKLVAIMQSEPSLKIKVGAHTDSRGTNKYNQWLSDRRGERTVQYVISKGIGEDRISYDGFGETRLINDCKNGVYCPEDKHAKNRRSEFMIEQF